MKIAIGDIVDRYSICKLKQERLSIDNNNEINALLQEIDNYKDIKSYVDKLYDINAKIWNYESDIRKGNEDILGLEEIGRRAIKIREYNSQRVSLKNEINSKYDEGYKEIKMIHGSHIEPSLIVTLTTVPERLEFVCEDALPAVLTSICEQDDTDYEIHFNVPYISKITNKKYIIPEWLEKFKLKYEHLKIFRTDDIGPSTKMVPTIKRVLNDETIILVVDDDLIYHNKMVEEHRKHQEQFKGCVCGYDGVGGIAPKTEGVYDPRDYDDNRNHFIVSVTKPLTTKLIQHYKSVSYKRKLFKDEFFTDFLGKTYSDDVLFSYYFLSKNIDMIIMPYEPENKKFNTYNKWNKDKGVTSFPVLRHAHGPMHVGTRHPEMLKVEDRFFVPDEFLKYSK
jgi:hypothetical protein